MYKPLMLMVVVLLAATLNAQENIIDLSGTWHVTLSEEKPEIENTTTYKREGIINLPSSLARQGYGLKTTGSDFGVLTPEYKYLGIATFDKDIEIPKNWKNKKIQLFLERVLWESKIFIDGIEQSTQDALGTPHIHNLENLTPGKHHISIEVNNDMIHNIGDKGHAYGEYTQSIWNGIVGRMELTAKDPTHVETIRTFSDIDNDKLRIETRFISAKKEKTTITFNISELGKSNVVKSFETTFTSDAGEHKKEFTIDLNEALKQWNEFDPTVYILSTTIKTKKYEDTKLTEFGYLKIGHDSTHILINNSPVFLRGNLDCVHFPLTGYPSTKVEDWEKIFKIYKSYGLNHARFHSWCPPEAAFKAANRVGIYLQAEASIWIDWWMSVDNTERGRPEMNTKGFPQGLGKEPERDQFAIEEMNRVVDFYGNNPSFTMFCIGNELGNSDFDIMKQWVKTLKEKDNRRLYSVSTARKVTEVDDYMATHYIQGIGRTRGLNGAHTDWDFEDTYKQMNIPIIAHEIGQWPVYPSWSEIDKYSGVLKARNFEEFKAMAEKNGIADQADDFKMASGALNQIMYKYETESFLRTKSCAGVQLLSMQDYQGQGEALIGWLDAHWESKGITTPEKFKSHFNETTPLLRLEKYVWTNNETLTADIQLSHFGQFPIKSGNIITEIKTASGKVLKTEDWALNNLPVGSLSDIGAITLPLSNIKEAQRLIISVYVEDTDFKNEWNIWVYPSNLPETNSKNIVVSNLLDENTIKALEAGKNVLLIANNLGTEENSVNLNFTPLYWSLTFFPGQGKTNIGMLLKDKHPAFKHFSTNYHSDWQWETIMKNSKGFILNETPQNYKPIAQVVDDFHRNNKEGAIFELKVGKGNLLVCGFNIANSDLPVARQLQYSLKKYMNSKDFTPTLSIDINTLKSMLPYIPKAENITVEGDFKNAILQVKAAENLNVENENIAWKTEQDQILVAKSVKYNVKSDGAWKDKDGNAWHGEEMTITLNCPEGMLGSFYALFDDWNKQNREGYVEFEGRKVHLGRHKNKGGKWVKFHVMREDSNDGKLILKTKATKGKNLMIRQIVLENE
ncbi:glycoside hydrolase family 2 TIM barrel-domain containing protein [Aestuariibaculum marinum]|uniref:Glycoside hydrolase family 2 n=1 Tax=Aestuariibaculum marinum TaxID=2683592 RepID=A0A8J6QB37_9FLAO|nr:glycoside hydrolase family 2 TIM barrel-domain containing protein [Aestuariibaculum marinum]MBD0824301.1 glycoside hydrolase family 2 [Aestuariibaculum marinum]